MLDEEKLKKLPEPAQTFWRTAQAWITNNKTEWVWIERGSEEHREWKTYFASKGWTPFILVELERERVKGMAMPTRFPAWFDSKYEPTVALQPVEDYYPKEKPYPNISRRQIPEPQQGSRANVLIRSEAPDYARMVELAPQLDIQDWRWDHRGIWIALNIYSKAKGETRPLKTPEARAEHLAKTFPDPELRESDKKLTASPALVKALGEQRREGANIVPRPHWSDLGS